MHGCTHPVKTAAGNRHNGLRRIKTGTGFELPQKPRRINPGNKSCFSKSADFRSFIVIAAVDQIESVTEPAVFICAIRVKHHKRIGTV